MVIVKHATYETVVITTLRHKIVTMYVDCLLLIRDVFGYAEIMPGVYRAVRKDHLGRSDAHTAVVGVCTSDTLG